MSKPSFLFGTMHVSDKRVFHFSDSVMLAIQSCPRFALEVQPDSAISKLYKLFENTDSLHSVDKMLTSEEYKKLSEKFKQKNGYAMGKANPLVLEALLEPHDNKPDDKQSFVDAYLYGIARTLNKSIYGLENASTQVDSYFGSPDKVKERLLGILDDDEAMYKQRGREDMIRIYGDGDIDEIYKYTKQYAMLDSTIIERNKVMASSIITNMQEEPIFSAVGAAHLPGPKGVIALLQQAGYTVTPVKATFTGGAEKYHVDYLKMNWPVFTDPSKGYSLSFPGKPITFTLSGMENVMYPDLANGLFYGSYVRHMGTPDEPFTPKEAFASAEKLLSSTQNNVIISKKQFLFKGSPCDEIRLKNNNRYLRIHLSLQNGLLYFVYVGSTQNHLDQPLADRYFNSFISFALPQKKAGPWVSFTNETGAFSAKFPMQPQLTRDKVPSKIGTDSVVYTLNMYVATDSVNSRSYMFEYYDYPPGTYISHPDELFSGYAKHFQEQGKLLGDPVKISKDGLEGQEIKALISGNYNTTIRMFIRGNRVYVLMKEITQAGLKDDGPGDPFFDSVQLLPFAEPEFYTYQPDSANYKIQLPGKPLIKREADDYTSFAYGAKLCLANNPKSGALYYFECLKISPYYRIANTDSLYDQLVAKRGNYEDTVIKTDTVTVGGIKGREVITMNKESKVKKRVRVLLDGENYFYLTARTAETELFSKTSNTFFNSLTLTSPSRPVDLAAPKAEKISIDLGSTDTTISKRALGAISYYEFKPEDLPYLYIALKRNYADDTSENCVRINLVNKLRQIGNDSTQLFLAGLYSQLKGKDEVKASILEVIPFLNKKTGYDIYIRLLTTDPPLAAKNAYKAFIPLGDTVEFAAKHFEQLLPFIKYDSFRGRVLGLAKDIATDKNLDHKKMVGNSYMKLMAYAHADIDNYIKIKDSVDNDYAGVVYAYMNLMKDFKFRELNDKLTSAYLEKDPNGTYSPEAVVARIYNWLPNKPALVHHLMDSLDTRYDLMEAYYDQKEPDKVPELYRRQDQYAKLCLYKYIGSGDDEDNGGTAMNMKLLGAITRGGTIYYAFKFSVVGEDEEKVMIGIAGPYKPGSKKLNFDKYFAYTTYEKLKTNWRTQASAMIKPLNEAYK